MSTNAPPPAAVIASILAPDPVLLANETAAHALLDATILRRWTGSTVADIEPFSVAPAPVAAPASK